MKKRRKKAIADAEAKEKDLEAEIEERAAKFGKIATEIEALKEQIAEDTETLKKKPLPCAKKNPQISELRKKIWSRLSPT